MERENNTENNSLVRGEAIRHIKNISREIQETVCTLFEYFQRHFQEANYFPWYIEKDDYHIDAKVMGTGIKIGIVTPDTVAINIFVDMAGSQIFVQSPYSGITHLYFNDDHISFRTVSGNDIFGNNYFGHNGVRIYTSPNDIFRHNTSSYVDNPEDQKINRLLNIIRRTQGRINHVSPVIKNGVDNSRAVVRLLANQPVTGIVPYEQFIDDISGVNAYMRDISEIIQSFAKNN